MVDEHWTTNGVVVSSAEVLATLQRIIEEESPVIVEHRFYKGARAPHRFVSDDFIALDKYLRTQSSAGDSFFFWQFDDCCRNDNFIVNAKTPNQEGQIPVGGAY